MKIMIGTPVYGGEVLLRYHMTILKLLTDFRTRHPEVAFVHALLDGALVAHSRNAIASLFLANRDLTHLLFIDADMGFRPELIHKMLAFGRPVVGVIYPQREQSLRRVAQAARMVSDPDLCGPVAQNYVGESDALGDDAGALIVRNGFLQMQRVGTGILLIQRTAMEQLRQAYPQLAAPAGTSYQRLGVSGEVFQVFESLPNPGGLYYGEDYAFSKRWTEGCKGELWASVDETVQHVGRQEFSGNYLSKMRHVYGGGERVQG